MYWREIGAAVLEWSGRADCAVEQRDEGLFDFFVGEAKAALLKMCDRNQNQQGLVGCPTVAAPIDIQGGKTLKDSVVHYQRPAACKTSRPFYRIFFDSQPSLR